MNDLYFRTVHVVIFILFKTNQTSYRQVHRTHTHIDNIQPHTGRSKQAEL
jgi:hypothetical protein